MLMGRTIQQAYGQPQQCVLTLPILPGTDGVQKMSKSLGNYIGITEEPDRMYGKAMSLPDEVMLLYFKLLTGVSLEQLDELEAGLADYQASPSSEHRFHPRLMKRRLARELVKRFWDEASSLKAAENFELLHPSAGKQAEAPDDLLELEIAKGKLSALDLVEKAGFPGIASRGDIKRLVKQGAVSLDGEKLSDASALIEVADGAILKVGKGNFARIKAI
jgi:tyrosyl-tRNA synthetase